MYTAKTSKQTLINEIDQRIRDIDVIANTTTFNGLNLANGEIAKNVTLQSGCGSDSMNNSIDITGALTDMNVSSLGVGVAGTGSNAGYYVSGLTGQSTGDEIREYIEKLDAAINKISEDRSKLGAYQNRLQSASDNLAVMNENYEQSNPRLWTVIWLKKVQTWLSIRYCEQTSATMLSQANQIPSIALQLLGQ